MLLYYAFAAGITIIGFIIIFLLNFILIYVVYQYIRKYVDDKKVKWTLVILLIFALLLVIATCIFYLYNCILFI